MLDATEEVGGIFLITADHGNAEDMVKRNAKTGAPIKDKQGNYQILTSHTCAPVRCKLLTNFKKGVNDVNVNLITIN